MAPPGSLWGRHGWEHLLLGVRKRSGRSPRLLSSRRPLALVRGAEPGQPLARLLGPPAKCVFSGKCGWNTSWGCCGNLAAHPVSPQFRWLRLVASRARGCGWEPGPSGAARKRGWHPGHLGGGESRCGQIRTNLKVCVLSSAYFKKINKKQKDADLVTGIWFYFP